MFLLFKESESHYIEQRVCNKLSTLLANTSIVGRENNGCLIASEWLTQALRERNNKDVITEIVCVTEMRIECFYEADGKSTLKRSATVGSCVYNYVTALCYMWPAAHGLRKCRHFNLVGKL